MSDLNPRPGQWIHVLARVVQDGPETPENVLVEFLSKTDQYTAWVCRDRIVAVVPPTEPEDGAIVQIESEGVIYQRLTDRWYRPGRTEALTWAQVCELGDPQQIT